MTTLITTPGVYDLPLEAYHADPCPTPSLSASGMKKIIHDCPARFWWDNPRLNPKAEEKRTKALDVGTAAHAWIIHGESFVDSIAVMPPELDLRSNAGKAFAVQAEGEGKTLIRSHEFEAIKAMRDAVLRCDLARLALENGQPEQSLFWQDEETGVWLRCRPDWMPTALRFIPDYKTARSCVPADFERSVDEYGYHIQAAHYLDGIGKVTGHQPDAFFFIVQEKQAPYLVSVCALSEEAMHWGRLLVRRAIRVFADCLERDWWPGYDGNVATVGLPGYAAKRYEAMDAMGLFDTPNQETPHVAAAE